MWGEKNHPDFYDRHLFSAFPFLIKEPFRMRTFHCVLAYGGQCFSCQLKHIKTNISLVAIFEMAQRGWSLFQLHPQ